MKKVKKIILILFTFIFIILIFAFNVNLKPNAKVDKGSIDLSNWNFSKDGDVKLAGSWDLFYGELMSPEQIKNKVAENYYNIPGRLSDQVSGKKQGYLTLHLKIHVPSDQIYGIYFSSLFTSSDIWINGVYLGGHGVVGKDIISEKPIYRPQYVYFPTINGEADIVIHASTYRDLEPRLKAATFGTQQQIMNIGYKNSSIDGFTIGVLFIIIILSSGFYFTKPNRKRNIYFAILCIILIIRCLFFNSRLLVQFYPNMDFEILSKSAAITFYLSVTFYILFLCDTFEDNIIIKKSAVIYGAFFTGLCLVTNNTVYDKIGILSQCITILFFVYLIVLFYKEIHNKNHKVEKNIFPFVIICITVINDFLVNNAILYNPYFVFYGILIFIISQSVYIVNDYVENYRKLGKINRDGLSSLYNNKYVKELLTKFLHGFNHKGEKFSLVMIDIDNFKGINDTFGHIFGDTVIIDVANILSEITEEKGFAGRYGGDEFIIILPGYTQKEACTLAQQIMYKAEFLNNKYDIEKKISLSIGVCENDTDNLTECISKVDSLMYKAKSEGKNKIISL